MLEIRKGKSSRSYENEFFRQFSSELQQLFEQNNWEGLLLGMPVCYTREDLQIDALLITNNKIIIIDFKNYKGKLTLPQEDQFNKARWWIDGHTIVKGGSSINPFRQLEKQRHKLIGELQKRISDFDRKSIHTIVCFQNDIQLVGNIPGKYQVRFSITDRNRYRNQIFDVLDVIEPERNYLTAENKELFIEKLFVSEKYIATNDNQMNENIFREKEPLTQSDQVIVRKIDRFLQSDQKVLTLQGTTRSGKVGLIPEIRELGFDQAFIEVPIFAYSGRLRRRLLRSHPELEDVESLFNTIYDFQNEEINQEYQKYIPLKTKDQEDKEKKLYIITDAHLMTNKNISDEQLKFGSGHLLQDIFTYFDIANDEQSKIIFIGDRNKISYGPEEESALNVQYMNALLQNEKKSEIALKIDLPDVESNNEIVSVCQRIAKNITGGTFNDLQIEQRGNIEVLNQKEEKVIFQDVFQNPAHSRILVYSNKQANKANKWMKKVFVQNGENLNANDFIVFEQTIFAYTTKSNQFCETPFGESGRKRINNGDFGRIESVANEKLIETVVLPNGVKCSLTFIQAKVLLQDREIVELLILEDYLKLEKTRMDKEKAIAYAIILSRLEKEAMEQEPFEQSIEYMKMIETGDFVQKIDANGKVLYRDRLDGRKKTKYENEYRQRIIYKTQNEDGKYFQILNAARIKYGWCMTVHKAMAYTINHVYFQTDQNRNGGKTNKDYYKWLYTGISLGENKVTLLRWQAISPFLNMQYDLHLVEEIPFEISEKSNVLMHSQEIELISETLQKFLMSQLAPSGGKVTNITSTNYLETVTIVFNEEELRLLFYYNKDGEVKFPRLQSGSEENFNIVMKALSRSLQEIPQEINHLAETLLAVQERLKHNEIVTEFLPASEWKIEFRFIKDEVKVHVQAWYNKKDMINHFKYVNGNIQLYNEVVEQIKTLYHVD